MASLNKVMIIGTLGRDPEISYQQSGQAIAKVSLATNEHWTDKHTGEKKERTEWHRVVFFGKQAESVGKYMTKGKQLFVEGKLQTSSWEKDGITRYSTDIIASNFQFLGNNQQQNPQQPGGYGGYQQPQNSQQNRGYQQPQGQASQGNGYQNQGGQFAPPPDDDIPF